MTSPDLDMKTRWTPSPEQDAEAFAKLTDLRARGIGSCGFCGKLADQTRNGSRHVETGKKRCWEDQNTTVRRDQLTLVTAHLLVGKQHGWWGDGIEVEPIPGVFTTREEASKALQEAGQKRHEETGKPVSGGWTYHWFPRQGDPDGERSVDGRSWQTRWAVFEDILCTFPIPAWSSRAKKEAT